MTSEAGTDKKSSKKRRRLHKDLKLFERNIKISERRQRCLNENQWIPICISEATDVSTDTTVPSSISPEVISGVINNTTPTPLAADAGFQAQQTYYLKRLTPVDLRESPLPIFDWPDSKEVWQIMHFKEELPLYSRDYRLFEYHPGIQPRMRAILLDWLNQVCEAFRLKRETFYLAVDFIDRYLSRVRDVRKPQLQLIGITALFIATKIEETHPVTVAELSFVTGGSCSLKEILHQEFILLKTLKWNLTSVTVMSWVSTFLQTMYASDFEKKEHFLVMPKYSQHTFVQIARLLDLCILDARSLQFPYSILATAAIYHVSSSQDIALSVSGYRWNDIEMCVGWMRAFFMALKEAGPAIFKFFDRIPSSEVHNVQTHMTNIKLLEKAQCILEYAERSYSNSTGSVTKMQSRLNRRETISSADIV